VRRPCALPATTARWACLGPAPWGGTETRRVYARPAAPPSACQASTVPPAPSSPPPVLWGTTVPMEPSLLFVLLAPTAARTVCMPAVLLDFTQPTVIVCIIHPFGTNVSCRSKRSTVLRILPAGLLLPRGVHACHLAPLPGRHLRQPVGAARRPVLGPLRPGLLLSRGQRLQHPAAVRGPIGVLPRALRRAPARRPRCVMVAVMMMIMMTMMTMMMCLRV
jgi:hypothetical protein